MSLEWDAIRFFTLLKRTEAVDIMLFPCFNRLTASRRSSRVPEANQGFTSAWDTTVLVRHLLAIQLQHVPWRNWSTLVPGTRWHNHSPTCCVFENLGIPPKIFDDFKSSVQSCKRRPPYLRLSRNNLWRSYLLDGISMLCYKWTVA